MAINVGELQFKSNSETTSLPLADHVGDIYNVKNWGAIGNGIADDTGPIQQCLWDAFGTIASPHVNPKDNKAVFFPAGLYLINDTLRLKNVADGLIFGQGKRASVIRNTTVNSVTFQADGMHEVLFKHMSFEATGPGLYAVPMDVWRETNIGGLVTSGNTFIDCGFDAGGGDAAIRFGGPVVPPIHGNTQGSESVLLNCEMRNAFVGLRARVDNALNIIPVGCSIHDCQIGIWNDKGCVPLIIGCHFYNNLYTPVPENGGDIVTGMGNPTVILGCTSTSPNFFIAGQADRSTYYLGQCYHNGSAGTFSSVRAPVIMDSCHSVNGTLDSRGGQVGDIGTPSEWRVYMRNCRFDNATAITGYPGYPGHVRENM